MLPLPLLLTLAIPAAAQNDALVQQLIPVLCVVEDRSLKGRTEFYDAKGMPIDLPAGTVGSAKEDAVVVVPEKKRELFDTIVKYRGRCPSKTPLLSAQKLREVGQAYAIKEFIDFDSKENRVKIGNGLISEMRVYLYKSTDGMVRIGREKLVSFNAAEVTSTDVNQGGSGGFEGQAQPVGKLHTHPNSDNTSMVGIPRHHPSEQDLSHQNESGYYDVVVSPLYVYFIDSPLAQPIVVWRENPFGENEVKAYLTKSAEADEYYARNKKFPDWYSGEASKKGNPWAR